MTQGERWQVKYEEILRLVKANRRNLSKYEMSERRLYTWMKHNRKLMNAGVLKGPRLSMFKELLAVCERYKRKNQYE